MLRYSATPRMSNGVAVDVERLVRDALDIDVAYIEGLTIRGHRLLGALLPAQKLLLVEAHDIQERQRFTIAHECGHLILDYRNAGSPSLFGDFSTGLFGCGTLDIDATAAEPPWRKRREILANKFAVRLLMPAELCRSLFRQDTTLEFCARELFVSKETCRIRFSELGFVDAHDGPPGRLL